jgi:hypothetical protein
MRVWARAAALAAAMAPAALCAQQATSALAQFAEITARMHAEHVRGDWRAYRIDALHLVRLLNGSPDALLEVARADAMLGRRSEALEELNAIAQMGLSQSIVKPDAPIARRMDANALPVGHAVTVRTIRDRELLPEDLDYDAAGKRFFLTSVLEKKIVTLDRYGRSSDFARSPDGWPMLALKIDARHQVVWATEAALQSFANVRKQDWGRSAVLRYDLRSGKLLSRIEGPHPSDLGDMTLAPNGDLLISDSVGGGLYRETSNGAALQLVDGIDFVSPYTPAIVPGTPLIIVPDYARGIGVLDLTNKRVRWIAMRNAYALEGIDGMYLYGNTLVAIQNGTSPERIVAFAFDARRAHILSMRTIERATPGLDPNHGVIAGGDFYFIDNAGWNQLNADGTVKKGAALTPARIARVHLSH